MKPPTRAARRGLAALALTCAAVVIPTTALAASGSPAEAGPAAQQAARTAAAAGLPRCGTGALTAWLGIPGDGYAGGVELPAGAVQHLGPCVHAVRLSRACPPWLPAVTSSAAAAGRGHGLSQPPGDAGPGRYRARRCSRSPTWPTSRRRPAARPPRWRCGSTRRGPPGRSRSPSPSRRAARPGRSTCTWGPRWAGQASPASAANPRVLLVAQAVHEQVKQAPGLLTLRWLAGGQGHAAQAGQHVGGFDVAAQRPGPAGRLQQRGDRGDELAAAVLVRVRPEAMTARSASAMPRLVVM